MLHLQGLETLPAIGNRLKRALLLTSGFQLPVDIGEVIEAAGDLRCPIERRAIIQHQLSEDFIDAVQLLQASGAIE
ncbi:hypothetical protein D3C76_928400 [compost metagenome]